MAKSKKKPSKPAKKKPAKVMKMTPKPRAARNTARVNTHGRNGSSSMAVAPEPEPIDLGPIVLPDGDGAVIALRQLAEVNDKALAAHKRYEDLKGQAKAAKERWDTLSEEVQTKLRQFTHASDMPLIDIAMREEDQSRMEAAAATGGVEPVIEVPDDEMPF